MAAYLLYFTSWQFQNEDFFFLGGGGGEYEKYYGVAH